MMTRMDTRVGRANREDMEEYMQKGLGREEELTRVIVDE